MAEPGGVMRPGIVHRLDKDTSGVMVVARTPFARMELARQFKERTVSKIYLAVVRGVVGRERFSICAAGRTPSGRAQADVGELTSRPRGLKRGMRARADAGGGRRRDAGRSAAADRPHPSDSRTPGFDRASVPWRSALWRPPVQRSPRYATFVGRGILVQAPGAACAGTAAESSAHRTPRSNSSRHRPTILPASSWRGASRRRRAELERWIELSASFSARPLRERTGKWPVDSPKRLR